jgi:hypothetical protein
MPTSGKNVSMALSSSISRAPSSRRALNEERLKTIIVDEAYRTIKVSEGKRQITIPMALHFAVVDRAGANRLSRDPAAVRAPHPDIWRLWLPPMPSPGS